jgi:hypothetical protein
MAAPLRACGRAPVTRHGSASRFRDVSAKSLAESESSVGKGTAHAEGLGRTGDTNRKAKPRPQGTPDGALGRRERGVGGALALQLAISSNAVCPASDSIKTFFYQLGTSKITPDYWGRPHGQYGSHGSLPFLPRSPRGESRATSFTAAMNVSCPFRSPTARRSRRTVLDVEDILPDRWLSAEYSAGPLQILPPPSSRPRKAEYAFEWLYVPKWFPLDGVYLGFHQEPLPTRELHRSLTISVRTSCSLCDRSLRCRRFLLSNLVGNRFGQNRKINRLDATRYVGVGSGLCFTAIS